MTTVCCMFVKHRCGLRHLGTPEHRLYSWSMVLFFCHFCIGGHSVAWAMVPGSGEKTRLGAWVQPSRAPEELQGEEELLRRWANTVLYRDAQPEVPLRSSDRRNFLPAGVPALHPGLPCPPVHTNPWSGL